MAAGGGDSQTTVCLDCHQEQGDALGRGPHAVVTGTGEPVARVSCSGCHGADARHWENDPVAFPLIDPAAGTARETAALCAGCHQSAHQGFEANLTAHAAADVSCLDCHRIHGGSGFGQLVQAEPGLCYGCHAGVQGQFAQSFHHPVERGVVSCSDCHLGGDAGRQQASHFGSNAACTYCHAEFQGPFPYEHAATVDYSAQGGGCVTCHDPHGSALPRLLKQPYEAPGYQLCTQCHGVPLGHRNNPQHGSEWDGVSCSECHVDIHGSYTSRLYLSPALGAQGCLAVGCHQQ